MREKAAPQSGRFAPCWRLRASSLGRKLHRAVASLPAVGLARPRSVAGSLRSGARLPALGRSALLVLLLLVALPARAQDTAPTSSAVVGRVEKLLRVPVRAATGGKVTLVYDLKNETHAEDFESLGVDGPVTRLLHGRGVNGNYPDLGAEFETAGLFLHKLPLKGDITIECQVIIRNIDLERSDMAVVMGYDEKSRHWVGARYGQLLVESNGHRVAVAPGSEPLDFTAFESLKVASMKLVRSGKKVSVFLNGRPRGTVTTSQGDGRFGFLLTGLHVAFASLSVTGVPDIK